MVMKSKATMGRSLHESDLEKDAYQEWFLDQSLFALKPLLALLCLLEWKFTFLPYPRVDESIVLLARICTEFERHTWSKT
jgi:hypothetical protein